MDKNEIKSVWAAFLEVQEGKKKKMDPVGQEDGDIDNDGDEDSSDEYLKNRRKKIGKEMGKDVKESEESPYPSLDKKKREKKGSNLEDAGGPAAKLKGESVEESSEESPYPSLDKKKREKKGSNLEDAGGPAAKLKGESVEESSCGKDRMKKENDEEGEKVDCPKCKGKGCDHCDDKGYHMKEDYEYFIESLDDEELGEYIDWLNEEEELNEISSALKLRAADAADKKAQHHTDKLSKHGAKLRSGKNPDKAHAKMDKHYNAQQKAKNQANTFRAGAERDMKKRANESMDEGALATTAAALGAKKLAAVGLGGVAAGANALANRIAKKKGLNKPKPAGRLKTRDNDHVDNHGRTHESTNMDRYVEALQKVSLDELSSKTLKSYASKANDSVDRHMAKSDAADERGDHKAVQKHDAKAQKRTDGINRASRQLAKKKPSSPVGSVSSGGMSGQKRTAAGHSYRESAYDIIDQVIESRYRARLESVLSPHELAALEEKMKQPNDTGVPAEPFMSTSSGNDKKQMAAHKAGSDKKLEDYEEMGEMDAAKAGKGGPGQSPVRRGESRKSEPMGSVSKAKGQ